MRHPAGQHESVRCESTGRDTLALSGALTFATAARALADAGRTLAAGAQTRLDLSGLTRADSAGLACVIALLAQSTRSGRELLVVDPPEGLRALADVCDARALLEPARG